MAAGWSRCREWVVGGTTRGDEGGGGSSPTGLRRQQRQVKGLVESADQWMSYWAAGGRCGQAKGEDEPLPSDYPHRAHT
jgi:hypothetical protein